MSKKWNMERAEIDRQKRAVEEVVIHVLDAVLPDFDTGNISKEHRVIINSAVKDFLYYKNRRSI